MTAVTALAGSVKWEERFGSMWLWSTRAMFVESWGRSVMGGSSVKLRSEGEMEKRLQRCRISGRRERSSRGMERKGIVGGVVGPV